MNFDKLILGGRLTSDIVITKAKSGTSDEFAIGKGTIAVNVVVGKDSKGKLKTETNFVDFTAFGKRAENMAKYFQKGSGIFLEGQLRIDAYTDKDGNKKKRTYMLVEKVDFVDKRNNGDNNANDNANDNAEDSSFANDANEEVA